MLPEPVPAMVRSPRAVSPVLAALTFGLCPPSSAGQIASLPPVEEAARDSTLLRFRADLLGALQQRDTAFIVSIVAPNVANGFGGDVGLKDFRYFWFGGGERNRKIEQLVEALQLGGVLVDDSTYAVPYYAYGRRFPSGLDAHGHALVLGEGVRVRQSPGSQRPVVAILANAVVSLPKGWTGHPDQDESSDVVWLQVGLGDGKVGYVAQRYLRSPLGLRVTFRKRSGHWVLTSWAEGD